MSDILELYFLISHLDGSSIILNIFFADCLACNADGKLETACPAPIAVIKRMYYA